MKLVVGLGNPGARYAPTRHNVGFRIVESLALRHRIPLGGERFEGRFGRGRIHGLEVGILEPQTYMNASGEAVARALRGLAIEDPSSELLLAFDDVDLPFGRIRVRPGGGDGGHLGVRDVIACLGDPAFARLRFGIGRPLVATDLVEWVLQPFSAEEEAALPERLARASDAIELILCEGVVAAMNRFNAAD